MLVSSSGRVARRSDSNSQLCGWQRTYRTTEEDRMSYSVNQVCGRCKKEEKCADGLIIRNAVQGVIHQLPYGTVHLGSGSVDHHCVNFEEKGATQ